MKLSKHISLLFMTGAFVAGHAGATTLTPVSTDQLIERAEFIFQGVVTSVEYRNSDVDSADHVSLPHTFVTFEIERAFKGNAQSGGFITLRFQGGPDVTGSTMMIPGVPHFDVGDRDILFTRGNGTQMTPLVGWEQGRFRIVNGLLYTDAGAELWLTREGKFTRGKQHALEEVLTHTVGATTLRFGVEEDGRNSLPPNGAKRLDADGFANFVADKVNQLATAGVLGAEITERSVYIQNKFYVERPKPVAPPSLPARSAAAPPSDTTDESDPIEQEMLRQNGGNPVLDASSP